jgi:diphthine-ammonia ligase
MSQVFISWSGGKDSCLAGYLAMTSGLEVRCLANMITEDGKRAWTHGQTPVLLETQAQAIGIPMIQRRTSLADYETEFQNMVLTLKNEGIDGGVFGDIDLEEHRQWVESTCQKVDITPHLPLWGKNQEEVLREFVGLGFEAIVVAARAEFFGEEVLGQKIDTSFIKRLEKLHQTRGITLCGESGEYHTLVIDGPIFRNRLRIMKSRKVIRGDVRFLDIQHAELQDK